MSRLDDWAKQQITGFGHGAGDVARGALADEGHAYQMFLTQEASIGPPEPVIGDMVITNPSEPEAASDLKLHALIGEAELRERLDAHEIGQRAATEELDQALDAQSPDATMDMD